jgi:formate hydrogenlyase subunit 3/multisubunit Na+/H+ antiporter MnhD subunit
MMIVTWLRIGAIGLPLIGALTLWRWKEKFLCAQRWLVAIIFGLLGPVALTLFVLNRHYACILLSGRQNCLFDGLATLSLVLLSLVLAGVVLRGVNVALRGVNKGDYILMLLLSSAWAGMALAQNLFVLLIFLNLFLYVIYRWLNRKGLKWRFLMLRDDYEDDHGPG